MHALDTHELASKLIQRAYLKTGGIISFPESSMHSEAPKQHALDKVNDRLNWYYRDRMDGTRCGVINGIVIETLVVDEIMNTMDHSGSSHRFRG